MAAQYEGFGTSPDFDRELFRNLELAKLAQRHIADSNGKLVPVEIDPVAHPEQRLDAYHIEGYPVTDPDLIVKTATAAYAPFPKMVECIDDSTSNIMAVEEAGDILKSGGNVWMAASHGQLDDLAFAEAALSTALRKRGHDDFSTAIIVSHIVPHVGFKLKDGELPAVQGLQLLNNDVYFSYPDTDSIANSPLSVHMSDEMKENNKMVAISTVRQLGRGGVLLAAAPTGETAKQKGEEEKYVMGRMNRSTARIMSERRTYILPTAVGMEDDEPFIEFSSGPVKVSSEEEAHNLMHEIAATMSKHSGKQYHYRGE